MNLHYNYKDKPSIDLSIRRKIKRYSLDNVYSINFINKRSIDDSKERFINKFERKSSKRIDSLRKVILNCLSEPEYFIHNFVGNELRISSRNDLVKIDRLNRIIKNNYDYYPDLKNDTLFKYFPNSKLQDWMGEEHGFQVFFTNNNNILNVYLIDLYHLGFPSIKDRKKEIFDLNEEYNRRKKYKYDIEDCLFNFNQ